MFRDEIYGLEIAHIKNIVKQEFENYAITSAGAQLQDHLGSNYVGCMEAIIMRVNDLTHQFIKDCEDYE